MLKRLIWNSLARGWLGRLAFPLGPMLRRREHLFGLRNPLYMSHAVTEQAGGLYLSDAESYIMSGSGQRRMLRFDPGLFEPDITYLMQRLIRPDDAVIDVGANIGFHTVTMARAAAKGRVYAFEPVSEMLEQNALNCTLNGLDNVTFFDCALGDRSERRNMHVSVGNADLQGTNTLIDESHHLAARDARYETRAVSVIRLDDLAAQLDLKPRLGFMKIDTEGFDTHVLEGALQLIRTHRPVMLVEAHSRRLDAVGKSWRWYLETFPDHRILVVHSITRARPYLYMTPLREEEPEIAVNLLMLPRQPITAPETPTVGDAGT